MTQDSLLFRQVNPNFVREGRITSQVFKPTPKDGKLLSVYDGELITAQNSYMHYTVRLGFSSLGVVAVTPAECGKLDLRVNSDPIPFPEHAVIDFRGYSNNQITSKAKYLKDAAVTRGWEYTR
ncbi:MAG: hypothetical protein OXH96_15420 [Spirochaetaceae bacterium]|nr:hypothetical protein [Spirochaetaceae bacterium]